MGRLLDERDLTRRRYDAPGGWSTGEYDRGAATSSTIRGAVQPLGEDELEQLELVQRRRQGRVVYTRTDSLRTLSHDDGTAGDEVVIDSVVYEVVAVERWPSGRLAHYKATVLRLDEGRA